MPAFERAIVLYRAEIRAIAENPEPATFANTLEALERSGKSYHRVGSLFSVYSGSMSTPEIRKIETSLSPKLAAFGDELYRNPKLFGRIEAVYRASIAPGSDTTFTAEAKRLAWHYETSFVRRGARLSDADQAKSSAMNQRLATLYTKFSQNELGDEEDHALLVVREADLAGLPRDLREAAALAAAKRGKPGQWLFANTRSAIQPFLTYADNRALREKAFRMWTARGDGGAHDNNGIVTEILKLRDDRAKILGFPTYAHWKLQDTMAKDPLAAMDLMMKVWKPAVQQAHHEVKDMQAIVDQEKGGFKIAPWDYRYYMEKVRKTKYDLDLEKVKPYLDLEKVRSAMFWSAGKLYGFQFTKIDGLPVFHPDVSVYDVKDSSGAHRGLWYFDPYARDGKNSGAWMNAYREQQRLDGPVTTIVSNNSNFISGKADEPTLISWDDAVTLFHEFGHALHGLSSSVTYPSLSGTETAGDFVEFPSQFNENWLTVPAVLKFLTNREGKPLPHALIAKILKTSTFSEGFLTTEFLASGIVDLKLHLAAGKPIDPRDFEVKTLAEIGMPDEIVMRHRIPHFGHAFGGEGYAAGYYGYLWAQVLDYDAFAVFAAKKDPFDATTAKRFYDTILSVGNTVDPGVAFRNFRGRNPEVTPLLRARGFVK